MLLLPACLVLPPSPQVLGFWQKAQRVVLYKVRTEAEARKKEVMDKQVGADAGAELALSWRWGIADELRLRWC